MTFRIAAALWAAFLVLCGPALRAQDDDRALRQVTLLVQAGRIEPALRVLRSMSSSPTVSKAVLRARLDLLLAHGEDEEAVEVGEMLIARLEPGLERAALQALIDRSGSDRVTVISEAPPDPDPPRARRTRSDRSPARATRSRRSG